MDEKAIRDIVVILAENPKLVYLVYFFGGILIIYITWAITSGILKYKKDSVCDKLYVQLDDINFKLGKIEAFVQNK